MSFGPLLFLAFDPLEKSRENEQKWWGKKSSSNIAHLSLVVFLPVPMKIKRNAPMVMPTMVEGS